MRRDAYRGKRTSNLLMEGTVPVTTLPWQRQQNRVYTAQGRTTLMHVRPI